MILLKPHLPKIAQKLKTKPQIYHGDLGFSTEANLRANQNFRGDSAHSLLATENTKAQTVEVNYPGSLISL